MKIAVYTSIFGSKDILNDPINFSLNSGIEYFCFTDQNELKSSIYNVIKALPIGKDFSKTSKHYKILGYTYLPDFEYLVYHDGNLQMDHSKILDLVKSSNYNFLSSFEHPHRNCFYEEAKICIKRNKDLNREILKQVIVYSVFGMPKRNGLNENSILVINKKNLKNSSFLMKWWKEVEKFSRRDQLSLPYLIWKEKIQIGLLEGNRKSNKYSLFHEHIREHYLKSPKKIKLIDKAKKKLSIILINFILLLK
ncbi:glycosyltransferase domain-containing protein [Cognataquiflexum aquatile]|uniref:glycosyltransferase domain-containing protein n=1 Tax=Cognataquiflexum aquatile TaxID=2249427 RepID=UPI000DEAF1F4|nr:glycosyltransferase domain-containing protein [Cognataquiflexum aquatile]